MVNRAPGTNKGHLTQRKEFVVTRKIGLILTEKNTDPSWFWQKDSSQFNLMAIKIKCNQKTWRITVQY